MNKKGISLSILVFVVASIVLLGLSLVSFSLRDRDIDESLGVYNGVDEIYIKKVQLDYYLDSVFERSVVDGEEGFVFGEGVEGFVEKFREEFALRKLEGFEEVDMYVNGDGFIEGVSIVDGKVVLKFEVVLISEVRGASLKYNYNQIFEKTFKV
ncbi:hypothetical protein HOE04_05565 [archaeon]|jgi:hypothetical protein|nr:hypothetical protein [archaeon]